MSHRSSDSLPHFLRVVRSVVKVTGAALPVTALAAYTLAGAACTGREEQGVQAVGGYGGQTTTGEGGSGGSGGSGGEGGGVTTGHTGTGGDAPDGGK